MVRVCMTCKRPTWGLTLKKNRCRFCGKQTIPAYKLIPVENKDRQKTFK